MQHLAISTPLGKSELTVRCSRNDKAQIAQLILGKLQLVLVPSIRMRSLERGRTRPDGRADRRRVRGMFRQNIAQQVGQKLGDRVGERFDATQETGLRDRTISTCLSDETVKLAGSRQIAYAQCGYTQNSAMQFDDGSLIVGVQVARSVPLPRQFRSLDLPYKSFLSKWEEARSTNRCNGSAQTRIAYLENVDAGPLRASQDSRQRADRGQGSSCQSISLIHSARRSLRSSRLPNFLIIIVHALGKDLRGTRKVINGIVYQCMQSRHSYSHP